MNGYMCVFKEEMCAEGACLLNGFETAAPLTPLHSNVIPDLRLACFRCAKCAHEAFATNEGGKVEEPLACAKCSSKSIFSLVHNNCTFSNKQLVKMQEKPNDIPEGETPHAVVLHVYEANVDVCRLGDGHGRRMMGGEHSIDVPGMAGALLDR